MQTQSISQTSKCIHHWKIEPPEKDTSEGICLKCGATQIFPNQFSTVLRTDLWAQTDSMKMGYAF